MTRPRLVFVDHSYHRATRSTDFLRELLQPRYDVAVIWNDAWNGGRQVTAAEIEAHAPDAVVFFQDIVTPRQLRRLRCRNITWVIMFDNIRRGSWRYRRYAGAGIKTLHFSAESERYFANLGFECRTVRYFPPAGTVSPEADSADIPAVFFWLRRSEIGWDTLKAVLGPLPPRKIVLRYHPDPGRRGARRPAETALAGFNVQLEEGWLEPSRYRTLLASCDLFMAPRLTEGIGMAALEAMAQGVAVIAPDTPTMNEYIRHGDNGYLYDPERPGPIDFTGWPAVKRRAHGSIREGFAAWQSQRGPLCDYIGAPPHGGESASWRLKRRLGL